MHQTHADGSSNRAVLTKYLKLTRVEVADGERRIADQKQLIALNGDGCGITWTTTFLSTLEHMQAMHVAHRERLEQQLGTANPE
jgi:hypothetical protein